MRRGPLKTQHQNLDIIPSGIIRELGLSALDLTLDRQRTYELIKSHDRTIGFSEHDVILSAQSRRCQSTANLIQEFVKRTAGKSLEIKILPCLNEVRFNLPKLYPEFVSKYESAKGRDIDDAVMRGVISGEFADSIRDLQWRVEYLASNLLKQTNGAQKAIVVSHEYFMRTVELYINKRGFSKITLKDFKKTHHHEPMQDFRTSASLLNFSPLRFTKRKPSYSGSKITS